MSAGSVKVNIMETIAVLAPDGQLMGGGLNETLHGEVQAQIASGRNLVVVDLQKVPWINSSGIGTLSGCRTECRDAGGIKAEAYELVGGGIIPYDIPGYVVVLPQAAEEVCEFKYLVRWWGPCGYPGISAICIDASFMKSSSRNILSLSANNKGFILSSVSNKRLFFIIKSFVLICILFPILFLLRVEFELVSFKEGPKISSLRISIIR